MQEYIKILNTDPASRLPKDVNVLMKGTREIPFFKNYIDNGEKRVHIACCTYMKHQANVIGDEVISIGELSDKLFILLKGQAGLMMLQPKITQQQQVEFEQVQQNGEGEQKKQDQNVSDENNNEQKQKQHIFSEADKRTRNTSIATIEEQTPLQQRKERKDKSEYESRKSSNASLENNLKFKNLEASKKQQQAAQIELNSKNTSQLAGKLQQTEIKNISNAQGEKQEVFQEPVLELVQVKLIEKGDIFGEVSLVQNRPSIFAVHCLTECQFAILEKKEFNFILGQLEEQRIYREMRFLGSLDYFMHWSSNQIKYLYIASKTANFKRNQVVFSEKDHSDYIYFVKSGTFEKIKTLDYEVEKDVSFLELKGASQQLVEMINIKYRLFYMKDGKKNLRLSQIGERELFGEEDILNHKQTRSFSVVCVSQAAEIVMIKKRDFYQKVLDSDSTKKMVKYRNKQKRIVMDDKMKECNRLIKEYKQYLMDNFGDNVKQVQLNEYLQTTNKEIKQSGISELLPLNLSTNIIQRYKTGQESQSIVQHYLDNNKCQRINLKRRIYEKVNTVSNTSDQANLLVDYINNYKYAEPFGIVQIQFNRQKPQPKKECLDRIKELQSKQEKLRQVLRSFEVQENKNTQQANKEKLTSAQSQNSLNSRIIHTPISSYRKQLSHSNLNNYYKEKSPPRNNGSLQNLRYQKRSISTNEYRGSEHIQRYSEEISIFQNNNSTHFNKVRSISQMLSKNTIEFEEDISPKKTLPSERSSHFEADKSINFSKSIIKREDSKDHQTISDGSSSEFKHILNKIINTSNNYEKISTHQQGFPIRIKTSQGSRDQVYYQKLHSQVQNNKGNYMKYSIIKNNVPLIKDLTKINSYLGLNNN